MPTELQRRNIENGRKYDSLVLLLGIVLFAVGAYYEPGTALLFAGTLFIVGARK